MGVYDPQVATALRLIREKGKVVSLVRKTNTTPDNTQPWNTGAPTEVVESVSAVFLTLNNKDMEVQHYVQGTEIHASDRKVLIAGGATATPPKLGDVLRDGTVEWAIQSVVELAPNGEQILYTLRVRR